MAKRSTPVQEPETEEVVIQETAQEVEAQEPQITLNEPAEEPVQIGHGSRDFGRQPKSYEEVTGSEPAEEQTEQPPQQDGGQEQA